MAGRRVLLRAVVPPTDEPGPFLEQAIGGFAAARSAIVGCFPATEVHADLDSLLASPLLCGLAAGGARLAVWPKAELAAVGVALCGEGVALHPREFAILISVVRLGDGCLSLGVEPRELVHDRMVVMAAPASPGSAAVCRAQHKLEELCVVSPEFGAMLRRASAAGTTASALAAMDVGASPGGWTCYLAQRSFARVFAVDPGALDPAVLALPAVTHLRCQVQAVDWVGAAGSPCPGFALLACDMNGMDCRDEMRLMVALAPLLRSGALLVVTLKLPAKVSEAHARKLQGECVAILEASGGGGGSLFSVCGGYWLLANRNNERTLVATKA